MTTPADLYDRDFYRWTQAQARALRRLAASRPNAEVDLPHIAMEIADLGKEQRNAVRAWTQLVIEYLLLLEHSPATAPRAHWIGEIVNFRTNIRQRLTATLRRDLHRRLPVLYDEVCDAVRIKLRAHGEADRLGELPAQCPYALDQVLEGWLPADS